MSDDNNNLKEVEEKSSMNSVHFIYTDSIELKEDDNGEYIEGYIATGDKDIVNDVITSDCMTDMLSQLNARNIKCDLEHEAFRGDKKTKDYNMTKIPFARATKANYDGTGLTVRWIPNKDYKRFDDNNNVTLTYSEVKNMIKNKQLDAFSIAYIATDAKMIADTRMLNRVTLLNVALTGNAVNANASMRTVMLKSLDSVPDLMKNEGDPMDTKETKSDETPKVEVKSEDISKLTDSMKSLTEEVKSFETRLKTIEEKSEEEAGKADGEDETKTEVKAVSEVVDGLKKEFSEVKDRMDKILNAPAFSAKHTEMKAELEDAEKKSIVEAEGPLDLL